MLRCTSQNELKAKWDFGEATLEESKKNAEKNFNELNEQVIPTHCSISYRPQ